MDLKIAEKKCKEIVTKSNIPDVDYAINPYTGCQHGCKYCYAEFMKKYTGHDEEWGSFVDVKINAPLAIKPQGKLMGKTIFFSSVTDPYQPCEAKYMITRQVLERMVTEQPVIEILTKSALMARDIDVFRKFRKISIGVSLAILDNDTSRKLEPLASPPLARLGALKKCREVGLETYVFVSPIFPYISELGKIISIAAPVADYIMFENLNIRPTNEAKIFRFLKVNFPGLVPKYEKIYKSPYGIEYWNSVEKEINELCKKHGKESVICFHHGGFSRKK